MNRRILVLILLPLHSMLFANSPALSADQGLEPFAGMFKGSGTLYRTVDAEAETVRCRITGNLSDDRLSLVQTGACAVPGSKLAVDGRLTLDPTNGRIKGTWTDVASGSAASVSGRKTDNGLNLTIVSADRQTGESRTLWMVLKPASGGYSLTTRAPNPAGGKFISGKIQFTK